MATVKISELPSITGATAVGTDVLPLVDVSLNTTNKITRDEFFKNIQGDVGIGTATPQGKLHVYGAGQNTSALSDSGAQDAFVRVSDSGVAAGSGGGIIFASQQSDDTTTVGMAAIKGLLQNGTSNTVGDLAFSSRAVVTDLALTERMRLTYTGSLLIGTSSGAGRSLSVSKDLTGGGINAFAIFAEGEIQTDVTGQVQMNRTQPTIVAAHPGLAQLTHYSATQGTFGAGSAVTTQTGFQVEPSLIGATTNVGFSMNGVAAASVTTGKFVFGFNSNQAIASGGGTAYNLYAQGTAPNYFAGRVGVGTTGPITPLHVVGATVTTGVAYKAQPAQTSKAAAATLTIAELLTGIVQYTGAVATLTLPTGTSIEGGVPATFPVDMSFDVSVINTGTGIATLGTATGLTLVGSMVVAIGASGLFRFRKTAANTYTVYRIS